MSKAANAGAAVQIQPSPGVCTFCRSEMPAGALICLKCKSARGWYFWYKLGAALLTVVAIPALAWAVTEIWKSAQTSRLEAEARRRDENGAVETLMKQLETTLSVTDDLLAARETLERGCAHGMSDGGAKTPEQQCLTIYLNALSSVDRAMNRLAWQIDSLALISTDTYGRLKGLKLGYWNSCADSEPFGTCGWRQRAVRSVYGFALPLSPASDDRTALIRCHPERAGVADEGCKRAVERLRQEVTKPLEQETSLFFCSYVMDLNGMRMEIFRERARAVGSGSAYARLVDRLSENMQNSTCAERIRKAPLQGPTSGP